MADRRKLLEQPTTSQPMAYAEPGSEDPISKFLMGLVGMEYPGGDEAASELGLGGRLTSPYTAGAAMGFLPLAKLLQKLGVGKGLRSQIPSPPTNFGNHVLRNHELPTQAVHPNPEFVGVGGEEAFNKSVKIPSAKELAEEKAYERIMAEGDKKGPQRPARRRLYSGRPLDK
jgi:hypothetical protein